IDIGNTIIADGSGLSRHNLIAPATMMQVLQYIAQHDNELNFIMQPEGMGRLFAIDKMAEGPFPEHYEPFETPLGTNPLHPNV
ncbi:D-alanyl-D-alanine carboxypeptidase, partial [Salmonella enterica subsp. enterica serovar Montevideo]|nr:D-alanyl-D-alanine carboxypeptidase [Salmonella enterica subsp. enterica serovar Montevideo]